MRPLLTCTREEVEGYCRENGLSWVDDRTNRDRAYARNRIRLEVVPALEKVRHTLPQSSLTEAAQRQANARGAYRLRPGAPVSGRRLLLVDDVVTSGATLGECAYLLKQAGAERVWCLTLAQAGRREKNPEQRKN